MTNQDIIYAKAGCPFTFRFILFLNDVDKLSNYEVRVAQAGDSSYEEIVKELESITGEKASFPTMKLANGDILVGSECLIEWVATQNGVSTEPSPIVNYFNQYMAPVSRQLVQQLRAAQQKLNAQKD